MEMRKRDARCSMSAQHAHHRLEMADARRLINSDSIFIVSHTNTRNFALIHVQPYYTFTYLFLSFFSFTIFIIFFFFLLLL